MGKKLGFLVGLAIGAAAAHTAYHRLSDTEKDELKADLQEKVNIAKDRAVDYAFYASDAWDDFKETFADQSQNVSDRVKNAADQFTQHQSTPAGNDDTLRDELTDVSSAADDESEDIVLNSEDTFGGADVSDQPVEDDSESDSTDTPTE